MADDFASLNRRLAALENNRAASLRFGTVVNVDEKTGAARVQVGDADRIVSMPLRTLQPRTHKDKDQNLPEEGGQVACLFSGQGYEQGVVLGSVYSDQDPSPARPPQVWYRRFEDGTELEYDRKEHRLTLNCTGDITIKARGTVKISGQHVSIQEAI